MSSPEIVGSGTAGISLIDMIGFWIGVAGLIVGIVQTYRARSARRIYRNGCKIRCRDASDKAQRLGDNMVALCRSINSSQLYLPLSGSPDSVLTYAQLSGHIGASLDVAKDWVRFCLRLNEEHEDEFKEPAIGDEQLQGLRLMTSCLAELEAVHLPTSNERGAETGDKDEDGNKDAHNTRVASDGWRRR